jgi:SAM-dependent methyltransferase
MVQSTETYKLFAEYYDLYVGKFSADLDFYRSICKQTDDILEVGCGTGRILKYFLEHDFKITGIDISQEMLDIALEKLSDYENSGKLKLFNYNIANGSLPEKYDKILITFYTFNYIINKPVDFLKNIFGCMKEDGSLVIDLFYPKSFTEKNNNGKWTEQTHKTNQRQIKIRDNRRLENDIEYRTQVYYENGKEITFETERKYYSPDEIKNILQSAGFKEILFSSTYSAKGFSASINPIEIQSNFIVKAKKSVYKKIV